MTPAELTQIRTNLGLTRKEMAERVGMSLPGYRKWEQGQRPISGPALVIIKQLIDCK